MIPTGKPPRQEWPRLSPAQLNSMLDEIFMDFDPPGLTEADVDDLARYYEDGLPQPKLNFHDL